MITIAMISMTTLAILGVTVTVTTVITITGVTVAMTIVQTVLVNKLQFIPQQLQVTAPMPTDNP